MWCEEPGPHVGFLAAVMAADQPLEFLFEFENSRRRIVTSRSRLREALEKELTRFGLNSGSIRYSGDCGSSNSYLLQRWSTTWNSFIDVEEEEELEDKDRVTVVPVLGSTNSETSTKVSTVLFSNFKAALQ